MTFIGMEPEKVLQIAQKLHEQQLRVHTVATTVSNVVASAQRSWRGADVERFSAEWNGVHRAKLQRASQALEELSRKAAVNAAQQMQTSNDYAGGAGASGANADPNTLLHDLNALWHGVDVSSQGSFSVGPHSEYSWKASPLGIPMSSSGDAWAGANGEYHAGAGASLKDGAYAKVDGQVRAGAGADWNASVGNSWLHADDKAHVFAGAQASGEAGAKLGWDGAGVDAKGSAMAGAEASNNFFVGDQFANSQTNVDGFAGAKAEGDAGAHLDWTGADAHVGGEAFAGAKATASQSVDIFGIKTDGSVSAEAGAGVDGKLDGSLGWHDIGGDVDLGAALGPGLDVKVGVHLDPSETLHDVGSLASDGWHAVFG